MRNRINKIVASILIMALTILTVIPAISQVEAASKHLVVINTRTNKMGYYVNNKLVKEFRVATGKKSTPTPQGKFKIVNKIKNRPYYSGGIPGGDPRNPLGDRWLGLHVGFTYGTTYGIHGNNNESSIGKHISGGCIRMHNKDVRWLFDRIPTGSYAIIKDTNQSFKQIAAGYGIKLLDGNEPINTWRKENNNWYYYNSKSERVKSWQKLSNKWYYFDKNGVMQTGWEKVDNKWYYFNEDGDMRIGWKKIDNKWYYFNEDGSMRIGWRKIDNKWYYFNEDGSMRIGWKKINNRWYYFNENGDMRTGWRKIDNKWYYFNEDGDMRIGWKKIDNKWYYFNEDGSMRIGWKNISNNWYYFYEYGNMATNTTIDGWEINESGVATKI